MVIEEYARNSRLPLKALRWMVRQGIINDPLTTEDQAGLALLEKVWMRREILRIQIRGFSRKRRRELMENADLETRWERYAFSRFRNGERVRMKQVISEIEMTFNFQLDHWKIKRLYQIRRKVYNLRSREKRYSKAANK